MPTSSGTATRRAIVARLCRGDATVGELAEPFEISSPAISRHLKVLQRAQLIEQTTEAQWRRCRISEQGLRLASGWLEEQRSFWTQSFDRLDDVLDAEAHKDV